MNLFGRPKPAAGPAAPARRAAPDTATAIQDLGKAIETLEKRQTHLEKQQDNLVVEAKTKMTNKDKKGAMFCLKRKKMMQNQIDTLMGTMITMEQQKMALENAATHRLAVDAIGGAQSAINSAMAGYDVETVEELMDNVQDGIQDAEEIGGVLGRGLGSDDIMNDDELLAEFNEMEQDELSSTLLDVPSVPHGIPSGVAGLDLPEAPSNVPTVAAAEEDEDARVLRELEASMAM